MYSTTFAPSFGVYKPIQFSSGNEIQYYWTKPDIDQVVSMTTDDVLNEDAARQRFHQQMPDTEDIRYTFENIQNTHNGYSAMRYQSQRLIKRD